MRSTILISLRPILFAGTLVTGTAACGRWAECAEAIPCLLAFGDPGPLAMVVRIVGRQPLGDLEVTQAAIRTEGTISAIGPGRLTIKTETSTDRMEYSYTRTTAHVDESGIPVPVGTLSLGLPVTVHYTRMGRTLVASKVVVGRSTARVEVAAESSPHAALPGPLRSAQ